MPRLHALLEPKPSAAPLRAGRERCLQDLQPHLPPRGGPRERERATEAEAEAGQHSPPAGPAAVKRRECLRGGHSPRRRPLSDVVHWEPPDHLAGLWRLVIPPQRL